MAEERDVAERLGVVEAQLETVKTTLSKVGETLDKVAETLSTFVKSSAVVEARLLAYEEKLAALTLLMNSEFARGREHMSKTDEQVAKIQRKCDQTEALRIAGQKHIEEAPNVIEKTNRAWISSDLSTKIMLGMMGAILALLLYLATGGKIGG